jgi:hypothetical protein
MYAAMQYRVATTSGPTPSAAQIAEMAAKNMIWVPAKGSVRGHWETKRSTRPGAPTVTVRHTSVASMTPAQLAARKERFASLKYRKQCAETGMPGELVVSCVEGLQAGVPMEEVMAALQAQAGAAEAAAEAASAAPAVAPVGPEVKPKSKVLLYGGLAAGGALVLFLVLRKKR